MKHDIEKLLKKAYTPDEKIIPSEALNQRTLQRCCEMTKRKPDSHFAKTIRLALACCALCILAGTSIHAVALIRTLIQKPSVKMDNGEKIELSSDVVCKKLPDGILLSEKNTEMTMDTVEKELGFSLLDCADDPAAAVYYSTYQNENKSLARVDIWCPARASVNDQKVSLLISILNEGADKGYILPFEEGLDAMGGKVLETQEYIETLNTTVTIYSAGTIPGTDTGNAPKTMKAVFIYDSVFYQLSGENITTEEILSLVKNMH